MDPFADIGRKLDDLYKTLEEQSNELDEEVLEATDAERLVRITVNGHGEFLNIQIEVDAFTHLSRLGDRITQTVAAAHELVRQCEVQHQENVKPRLPFFEELENLFIAPGDDEDRFLFRREWESGIEERVAKSLDTHKKLQKARNDFLDEVVIQEVGTGLGQITCNANGENVRVSIERTATRNVGYKLLEEYLITALNELQSHAGKLRAARVAEILQPRPNLSEIASHRPW